MTIGMATRGGCTASTRMLSTELALFALPIVLEIPLCIVLASAVDPLCVTIVFSTITEPGLRETEIWDGETPSAAARAKRKAAASKSETLPARTMLHLTLGLVSALATAGMQRPHVSGQWTPLSMPHTAWLKSEL